MISKCISIDMYFHTTIHYTLEKLSEHDYLLGVIANGNQRLNNFGFIH